MAAQCLLTFNESSGTTITNHGTGADCTIASSGSTNYTWSPNADDELSYLALNPGGPKGGGNPVTIVNMSAVTGLGTTPGDINVHMGLYLIGWDTSGANRGEILMPRIGADNRDGGIGMQCLPPTTSGFKLRVTARADDTVPSYDVDIDDLALNTLHYIGISLSTSGTLKVKVDSAAVSSNAGSSWAGNTMQDALGAIGRGEYTSYYGIEARLHWFYYERGGTAWDDTALGNYNSDPTTLTNWPSSSGPYSAGGSTGIQHYIGFQANQIGIHRNVTPGKAEFNAVGFAPSTSAGRQIDAAVGYANAVGFGAQAIYDAIGINGRINFNTGTHQTHVTREFFGLLGQLRALGFLVDQTNSQGFFPNIGGIYFQGPTGATVTVISSPSTFTASVLLRETNFVGFQAQTIRDFFPISASTHALGFTPQYVEFIKEITGPTTGEVNFSGFQAQAIILGQINDAIGQKGEVNLVGFQHAVDMWRTLDILQGRINMQGFAAGVAIFQGGTINLTGETGTINFDTLQQAVGMYRTFYPDSGLTNAEGYVPVPSTGTLVQSIVGLLNQEGFIPFIVAERYRGIVGEMRLEGFAPTIGGGLWTPKRRRATSWAAIN